jgi:hypothetical protein
MIKTTVLIAEDNPECLDFLCEVITHGFREIWYPQVENDPANW